MNREKGHRMPNEKDTGTVCCKQVQYILSNSVTPPTDRLDSSLNKLDSKLCRSSIRIRMPSTFKMLSSSNVSLLCFVLQVGKLEVECSMVAALVVTEQVVVTKHGSEEAITSKYIFTTSI